MKFSASRLFILGIALAPVALAQSASPSGGVLITRIDSAHWQVRLIAGGNAEQFSAVLESDLPISAVTGLKGATTTNARLLDATSLSATLVASPESVDAVNFSVSGQAKLCLRDTGSSGVNIYLGESLANAVPATSPLALTSVDACGDRTQAVMAASARKYHPGHYTIMVRHADTQTLMATALQPGVVGIAKRYTWRSLEPKQGTYDFSAIKSDLAWAAAHGTRLVAMIEYKTFVNEKAGPAYLDSYEIPNKLGGYTLATWSPSVYPRYNALIKALGAQVDSNPIFEGLSTQETSVSLDTAALNANGYTPEKHRDSLISMLSSACASLPTSRVFWYMNFLVGHQSYIGNIASAVAPLGVVMGGPDVWPDNQSLETLTYPFYTQFFGKMPLFGQVEDINYSEPHMTSGYKTKYWTMPELYNFALTTMHVNYIFWMRTTTAENTAAYDWYNALPVIAANATFSP